MKWTALYLPALPPGRPDPSKFDCPSEEAAWDFLYSKMCADCKDERARVLAGKGEKFDSDWPACACKWMVLPTEAYEKAESWDEINEAAGWKKVDFFNVLEQTTTEVNGSNSRRETRD
jgi:hypothetical protein